MHVSAGVCIYIRMLPPRKEEKTVRISKLALAWREKILTGENGGRRRDAGHDEEEIIGR